MKRQFPTFVAGMLSTALITGLSINALAATGAVSFNHSPIQFNGQQISAAGEDYALDNGCMAPSSITYTDEKGGGTTYLPARRIAELMGVGIGYDAATGAVTVSGEAAPAPATTPAPDTTASAADYSDWTAEEEAAYQEFKGLWKVGRMADDKSFVGLDCYKLITTEDSISEAERNGEAAIDKFLSSNTLALIKKCCIRLDSEMYEQYETPEIRYAFSLRGSWGWSDRLSSAGWECGYTEF